MHRDPFNSTRQYFNHGSRMGGKRPLKQPEEIKEIECAVLHVEKKQIDVRDGTSVPVLRVTHGVRFDVSISIHVHTYVDGPFQFPTARLRQTPSPSAEYHGVVIYD